MEVEGGGGGGGGTRQMLHIKSAGHTRGAQSCARADAARGLSAAPAFAPAPESIIMFMSMSKF